MNKFGIDHDALVSQFSQASAKQGEALRKSVSEATLKALQGRELTLQNIKSVLKSVTQAATAGAAQNAAVPQPTSKRCSRRRCRAWTRHSCKR